MQARMLRNWPVVMKLFALAMLSESGVCTEDV